MIENPFRNLYKSIRYCPPESRERLMSNVFGEWDDTTHDNNPLDHDVIDNPETLAQYLEWDGDDGNVGDVDAALIWLHDIERAFDLITPMLPPDELGGQYIDSQLFLYPTPWSSLSFDKTYDIRFSFLDNTDIVVRVTRHESFEVIK